MMLTPQMLVGAYDFLKTTKPFCRWNLPDADAVKFIVSSSNQEAGHYGRTPRLEDHEIAISQSCVKQTHTLMWVMGHEMIHLYQGIRKAETSNAVHNAEFRKLAKTACQEHGWDVGFFI